MITKRYLPPYSGRILLFLAAGVLIAIASGPRIETASADTGALVGQVTFSTPCSSGLGLGVAFDGDDLWYSCYSQSPDLFRADADTGNVIASYNVAGGLGALAWDEGRQKLWAGAGCGPGQSGAEIYLFDPASGTASHQFNIPSFDGNCLDDGLAYDRENDSLYHSWDGARNIRHISATSGSPLADDRFAWGGTGCYNSGLAIGGDLLYQGSDGCLHIWVVNKESKAAAFDFPSPGLRDEDLECDSATFPGKTVMWSKDAYNNTAYAFEIPLGSCNFGGTPGPSQGDRDIVLIRGIDSEGRCDGANQWVKNYLESPTGKSFFGRVRIGQYLHFNYDGGGSYTCPRDDLAYGPAHTCDGIAKSADELKAVIDSQATAPVTIVAHSMGGLVAAYLVGKDENQDWAESHVASVITFDSPLRGISDFYVDNWDSWLRDLLGFGSACTHDVGSDFTSVEDMRAGSDVVTDAAGAAGVVPFYALDATQFPDLVSRANVSLDDARPLTGFIPNWCGQPGSDPDTCEPPTSRDDDHGSIWGRQNDENGLSKGFDVGCGVSGHVRQEGGEESRARAVG